MWFRPVTLRAGKGRHRRDGAGSVPAAALLPRPYSRNFLFLLLYSSAFFRAYGAATLTVRRSIPREGRCRTSLAEFSQFRALCKRVMI